MRRREREELDTLARRRLERLGVELAGIRPESGKDPDEVWASEADDAGAGDTFLDRPEPVTVGPPGALGALAGQVLYAPRGRPLPPEPTPVRAPGRHAVPRRGGGLPDWVEDRVPDTLRGRVGLGGRHLTVLAGVVGLVLAVTGFVAVRGGGGEETVPSARFVAGAASASPSGGPSGSAAPAPSDGRTGAAPGGSQGASGDVVVDVTGKVRRPGIVTLSAGSRVQDALSRAGGVRGGVRTDALNLARVLVDGEQIRVGLPAVAGAAPSAVGSTPAPDGALVNINAADLTTLEDLPGVGPVTAQKILDWRTAHGAFTSVDELLEVDGIGDKTLADIAPHATL